ncbi:EndoU domain-containing protein [Paraburkholderia sp. LEh10]|uniref:EndoU domain-containing protein n=1 Tax=Paraburkholderia sp. LEh10 TaxID=2821353 RepID=UPI001AEB73B9|nr:EndoU domain-containing protein [Paraburkholderia sp. LEh10]
MSCDLTGHRKDHILNRHKFGAGKPGKTEFPAHWSDADILRHVSDVATDPKSTWGSESGIRLMRLAFETASRYG